MNTGCFLRNDSRILCKEYNHQIGGQKKIVFLGPKIFRAVQFFQIQQGRIGQLFLGGYLRHDMSLVQFRVWYD